MKTYNMREALNKSGKNSDTNRSCIILLSMNGDGGNGILDLTSGGDAEREKHRRHLKNNPTIIKRERCLDGRQGRCPRPKKRRRGKEERLRMKKGENRNFALTRISGSPQLNVVETAPGDARRGPQLERKEALARATLRQRKSQESRPCATTAKTKKYRNSSGTLDRNGKVEPSTRRGRGERMNNHQTRQQRRVGK